MPGLLDNRGPYSGYDPKKDKYLLGQPKQTDFTGAGNFYKGLASGALGLPSDLLQMMSDLNAAGRTPGLKSLQIPLTSDKIGGLLGADVNQDAFKSGLLGSPDPGDLVRMGGKGLLAMTLFHGTPHKFDKFDLAKIGSGEGAQAYGHGLYFAENPGVAQSYKNSVGTYAGLKSKAEAAGLSVPEYQAKIASGEIKDSVGHLYEVNIPDEVTAKMLDWDAPLSEQSEIIQKALEPFVHKGGVPIKDGMNLAGGGKLRIRESITGTTQYFLENGGKEFRLSADDVINLAGSGQEGKSIYQILSTQLGGDKKASAKLQELGIPGIRYLDAGSRGGKEGTRNIVLFDPDTITEVKRDGSLVYENKLGLKK